MVSAGNTKWESYGDDSATLFRDFYFGKYDHKNYHAKSIHATPNRPYKHYLYKNFHSNLGTVVNRVISYKEFGTGLPDDYRTKLRLHEKPTNPEDQAAPYEEYSDEDETFLPGDQNLKEGKSKVAIPAPTKKTRIMTNEKKGTRQETSGETPTPTANKLMVC
jgi:hypothetical protein